jgi:hypothetical protein
MWACNKEKRKTVPLSINIFNYFSSQSLALTLTIQSKQFEGPENYPRILGKLPAKLPANISPPRKNKNNLHTAASSEQMYTSEQMCSNDQKFSSEQMFSSDQMCSRGGGGRKLSGACVYLYKKDPLKK